MNERASVDVFGEVLVDEFPDGARVLGGAPFNVAWHLQAFGHRPRLVSRVGQDANGTAIRTAMSEWGMDLSGIQTDPERPSGCVHVTLDTHGQPVYDILADRAYDAIQASELHTAPCDLLYHGTLALRTKRTAGALEQLKRISGSSIFMDVNLRDPWWSRERVWRLADDASWVKLNEHELDELSEQRGDQQELAARFLDRHDLVGLIVTQGQRGAFALEADGRRLQTGPVQLTRVVDTVGAGDAFAAVTIMGIVRGWPLELTLSRAQEFAVLVVENRGAILTVRDAYERLSERWDI